jgi:hypothetical protein
MDPLDYRRVACPYCGEPVSVTLERLEGDQDMIQDCGICCRPIRLVSRTDPQLGTSTLWARRDDE